MLKQEIEQNEVRFLINKQHKALVEEKASELGLKKNAYAKMCLIRSLKD